MVYHFLNEQFGLKDIRERRLKLSEISQLNDPFDFLSVAAPNRSARSFVRSWRREMAKSFGLLCFSRNWQSPLQWAHYADRHRGVCLGFEVSTEDVRQVRYVRSRPAWPSTPVPWPDGEKERIVDELLYCKFIHWSYEDECRLFTTRMNPDSDGHSYVPFSDRLELKRVLVGSDSTISRAKLSAALGSLSAHVESFKVRPAFKSFCMVRQEATSGWR